MTRALAEARRNRYELTAVVANALIWIVAFAYLAAFPTYVTEWAFILPTSDLEARVDVRNVGEAYATQRSPYDARSLDPRVNYRAIMLSETLLQDAASRIPMPVGQLGKPRIRLIDQSSVMEFWISARSADLAYAKALALVAAFEQRIAELRADESVMRDAGIEESIRAARTKLENAQADLIRFKVKSKIASTKQLDDAVLRISGLQQRQLELESTLAAGDQFVLEMSTKLHMSPERAARSVALQSDAEFMASFERHAAAAAELAQARRKWDSGHPQVLSLQGRARSSFEALAIRARRVLGPDISDRQLGMLAISAGTRGPEPLVRELVAKDVQAESQRAELLEIDRQHTQQNASLDSLAQQYSELDELERRVKLAEAVFHSAIGKIEVGKSNIFSSYPLVQQLVEPQLPAGQSRRATLFVLLGALGGSALFSTALTLAWMRRKRT